MISLGLLVLRVGLGLTVSAHGAQKLFGWYGGSRIAGFSAIVPSTFATWPRLRPGSRRQLQHRLPDRAGSRANIHS